MNQGKGPESQTEPGRRGFHQEEASRGEKQLPLTIRCVRKARPDVMQGQFREVGDNFLRSHPSCQVLQNVLDRDPQPTDTRFSTSLTRLHGDNFLIVHSPKVLELCHTSNSRRRIPQAACFYSANTISCNRVNFCWLRFTGETGSGKRGETGSGNDSRLLLLPLYTFLFAHDSAGPQ